MSKVKRGDVLLVNLETTRGSEQRGRSCPCLVVSPGPLNEALRGIVVCPITDARHIKRSELGLIFLPSGEGGINEDSLVIVFQIRMIDKRRVIRRLGSVSEPYMVEVTESINAVLDIE